MYRSRARFSHIGVLVFIALLGARNAYAQDPELLWGKLQAGGNIVLLRHAQTEPGSGDPPNYVLGDCKTQRNLSEAGREQARRIGAAFRARKVPVEEVLSSEFCRCLETARLAFGKAEQWPMLNSIFENSALNQARVTALKERLGRRPLQGNIVIVSHNVNISAATGVGPAMGEAVIVAPGENGGFSVLGSLKGEVQ
jgi:broad specificity phosphatase PhoE